MAAPARKTWFLVCLVLGLNCFAIRTGHTCPFLVCYQIFTAYAIVRTEPSAISATSEEKKILHARRHLFRFHMTWLMVGSLQCVSRSRMEIYTPVHTVGICYVSCM